MNIQMFGRMYPAIVSAVVCFAVVATGAEVSRANSVLLAFSSDRCGHCQAMEPTLQRLADEGIVIRHVNVSTEPELAKRHGVRQVPTFVVLSAGRELTRLVGAQSGQQLRDAVAINPAGPLFRTGANVADQPALNSPQTNLAGTAPAAPKQRSEAMPSLSIADAVERARAATVRLRVHDGRGFGVGTGTIIDRHGEEALVLTCGHLFRETKLEAKIDVDLFVGGQVTTVPGKVIDYDAEDLDIALVVIRPGFEIAPVKIINPKSPPQSGQSVFSFGCDHGADPSRRDTRITGVNKYNQHIKASNIEIGGAPVDGRSGGGLFDQAGRLVGVCNAADYKGDVGIYTGPGSIKWQLDRVQLSHLYQTQPAAAVAAIAPTPASAPSTAAGSPETQLASLEAPMNHRSPNAAAPLTRAPLTVIMQDPNSPGGQRLITVQNPSSELVELISRHAR